MLQDYASGSRPLIDAALARNGIQVNIVQEIGHPATLVPDGSRRHRHQYSSRTGATIA